MTMTRHKKDMGRRRRRRITGRRRVRRILEKNEILTALHPTPTMKDWLPRPSTSLHSSPTNVIHVLWLRRRRYVFEILLSTLLLVMRNLLMMKYITLNCLKVEKINELINALNEKDRLLESKRTFYMRNMTSLLVFKNPLL
jgi:hypothetical protein